MKMTNKKIIKEVSKILNASESEFATEQKGKKILVMQYNENLNGLVVAEYNITKGTLKIK